MKKWLVRTPRTLKKGSLPLACREVGNRPVRSVESANHSLQILQTLGLPVDLKTKVAL